MLQTARPIDNAIIIGIVFLYLEGRTYIIVLSLMLDSSNTKATHKELKSTSIVNFLCFDMSNKKLLQMSSMVPIKASII